MNTTSVIGRLTKDPNVRETNSGTKVADLRIAIPRRKVNGEDRGAAFIDVVAWGKQAELAGEYLQQGRQVAVTGRLDQQEWKDDDDNPHSRVVIVAEEIDYLSRPKGDGDVPAAE